MKANEQNYLNREIRDRIKVAFSVLFSGRYILSITLALLVNLTIGSKAHAWGTDANGTPQFFVDSAAAPGGDGSAAHPWNELDQIDWTVVQAANVSNTPGQMHDPTSLFTGAPWSVIVEINGGPANGFKIYRTPLNPVVFNNPYVNYAVVRRQPNTGQIIIDGSQFGTQYAGRPAIDLTNQSGLYIIGNSEINLGGPQAGCAGMVACNAPVGVYAGNSAYANITGMQISNNGVGVLALGPGDMPYPTVAGQKLNVSAQTIGNLGYVAGGGLHFHSSIVCNNWDPNYHAQCYFGNSIYSVPGHGDQTTGLPNGYPQLIGDVIYDTAHPGQTDGIVCINVQGQSSFTFYQFENSVFGPGLYNCINLQQTNHGICSLGNLFINPYRACITKIDSTQVTYMANCSVVMKDLNANNSATILVDGPESQWDRIHCCSINGGNVALQGSRSLQDGNPNEQTNTEGNTILISPNKVANRFATDSSKLTNNLQDWMADFSLPNPSFPPIPCDPAARQFPTDYPNTEIVPAGSLAAALGLPPGSPIPSGYVPGFVPGSSSSGGGSSGNGSGSSGSGSSSNGSSGGGSSGSGTVGSGSTGGGSSSKSSSGSGGGSSKSTSAATKAQLHTQMKAAQAANRAAYERAHAAANAASKAARERANTRERANSR